MEGRMHIWGDDSSKPFQEGILIWDLKNSEEAKQIVVFETEGLGTHRNFFTGGKFVYLAANMKGYKGNIFVALDISEQTRRREVSRCWVEGGEKSDRLNQLHGLPYVVGEQAYLPLRPCRVFHIEHLQHHKPHQISRIDIGDFGSIVGAHTYMPIPSLNLAIATTEAIF